MTEPQTTDVAVSADGDKGLAMRGLWEVFYRPAAFFTELKNQPRVLVAICTIMILSAVYFFFMSGTILEVQMSSPQAQERLQGQPLPPAAATISKVVIGVVGTITGPIVALVTALFALFWGNFVFAGRATYRQLFSVMLYGSIIPIVGLLAGLPIQLAKDSFVPPFSLGVLAADQGMESPLFVLLSKFDVFGIFELVVVGIGLSVVYNVTRSRGFWLSLLSVGMISILHVLWSLV